MSVLAIDASVVVKWVFPERDAEADGSTALAVLGLVAEGRVRVRQPPHWLAEVASVVARLAPRRADEIVGRLFAMELSIADGPDVYRRACELAVALDQHVFDTLYHAVALSEPDGRLVTADERYYRRAAPVGCLVRLRDFRSD